jgi:hypothetical protein
VRPAAILGLVFVASCSQSTTEVIVTVGGDVPGAVALFARVVDQDGAHEQVHSTGTAEDPMELPATIHLRLGASRRVGLVVWVAGEGGDILAAARSARCFEFQAGGVEALVLSPAPDGWSPSMADGCRCDPVNPSAPMCPGDPDPLGDAGAGAADAGGPDDTAPPPDAAPPDRGVADGAAPEVAADAPADGPFDAAATSDARDATVDARPPDAATSVRVPNALFGFEMTGTDWTSAETPLTRDTAQRTEGAASVAFTLPAAGGTTYVRSRAFATDELGATGPSLSVDMFVGQSQVANANMEMWVDCPSATVNGVYLGYRALSALKVNSWTPVTFRMPAPVAAAYAGKFKDCKTWFKVDGRGLFRYDRMGFPP